MTEKEKLIQKVANYRTEYKQGYIKIPTTEFDELCTKVAIYRKDTHNDHVDERSICWNDVELSKSTEKKIYRIMGKDDEFLYRSGIIFQNPTPTKQEKNTNKIHEKLAKKIEDLSEKLNKELTEIKKELE